MKQTKKEFQEKAQEAISKAFENCRSRYKKENINADDSGFPFLLLGGDLSGIQKFIYNIASSKAAKSLKARSKYLVNYIEGVVENVKKNTGATDDNVICLSGGKFYMLLPNTQSVIKAISDLKSKFERDLWNDHKGQLSLNIDYVTFQEASPDLWKCLADKLTERKNQKYKSLLTDDFDAFFEPGKFNKAVKVCEVTGIESENCVRLDDNDNESPYVLPSVKRMTEKNGDGKTFKDYADGTYLGILRMDVDNLGKTFIAKQKDFSEYSAFSKWLNTFFIDDLKDICNKYKEYVNIIYAGGDDLFAVGRWDKLILFAHDVHSEFAKYIGNENLSISGGIAIVGEKFPIAKAAEMAGKAEDAAKDFNNKAKNAFNLFGESFSWKDEYDYIMKWKKQFFDLCNAKEKPMPRSILHKMMQLAEIMKGGNMKYVWHTAYFLRRFSENKSDTIKIFCEKLKMEVINNKRNYELMAIAARWAELELKEFENK
jgi:CRISPR/Cas system-associated protein Cas10 (large subunit of type III CRISPR-Cas system)